LTFLFGYMPQLAAIMSFGLASKILPESSFAAKPPKTMECTAPILAQAQVAKRASGIIGI